MIKEEGSLYIIHLLAFAGKKLRRYLAALRGLGGCAMVS
jgi:hypothetical protein